jgi:hypothetical protein
MGDPRIAYPSPVSPHRPLVSQGTVYSTPPASPIFGDQSDLNMDIPEEYELMDIDDGAAMPLDHDEDAANQQTVINVSRAVSLRVHSLT